MVIRQAHPGPGVEPYTDLAQKMRDGERYLVEEGIPWPVLVDDLAGTVHQVYGGLADPTYLIDADGRVAFYNMWTHAPTLHRSLTQLFRQGERGVVNGGIDHVMHMLPAVADGWRALRRGSPQSFIDLETAAPGLASSIWLGYRMRPLLAPVALRAEPLPPSARIALGAGALALLALAMQRRRRRPASR